MRNALSPVKASDESPKPSARTRKVPSVPVVSSRVNRPSALVSTVRGCRPLISSVTLAPQSGRRRCQSRCRLRARSPDQHRRHPRSGEANRGEAQSAAEKAFEP